MNQSGPSADAIAAANASALPTAAEIATANATALATALPTASEVAAANAAVTISIAMADSPAQDAFGRFRVSEPTLLLSATFEDDARPLYYESVLAATGTATHLPDESVMRLRVAADGDDVLLQSRQYFPYRTGQSQLIDMTFVMPPPTAGLNSEIGYGDDENGVFFRHAGTTAKFTLRSKVTGSVVNTDIAQASWNLDVLDGTGPSGVTFLHGKAQILVIDLQWLGTGRVRIGFSIAGVIIYCHEFLWANQATSLTTYMTTARLPVRWFIENVSAGSSNFDLKASCASVQREGTHPEPSTTFACDVGDTAYSVPNTGLMSIVAIRPDADNPRIALIPETVSFMVSGGSPIRWVLVLNPTLGSTLTYADVGGGSLAECSTGNETVTGGTVVAAGFVAAGAAGNRGTSEGRSLSESLPAVSTISGTPDQYVLAVESLNTATNTFAAFTWREVR